MSINLHLKIKKHQLLIVSYLILYQINFGQSNLKIELNENIELLTIIQYLGDRSVYPMNSIYLKKADQYFKPYKNEKAIKKIKSIMPKNSGDAAFPQLGMYCSRLPEFKLLYSLNKWKDSIEIKNYLNLCKEFSIQSSFSSFFKNEELKIELWRQQVLDTIHHYQLTHRLEKFMNSKRNWNIYLSPLVSWGAYQFELPDEKSKNEIHFVLGYNTKYNKDDRSAMEEQPFFAQKETLIDLIWHEGSHSYITPLIEKDKEYLSNYSSLLTDEMQTSLQKAGRFNWTWEYYLNELIVRGIVVHLKMLYFGKDEGLKETELQKSKGFKHMDKMMNLLNQYETMNEKNTEIFFKLLKKDLNNW